MKRTNIMLTDSQHSMLSAMARREGRSMGDKIREAIDNIYKKKDPIEKKREVALMAYREGFISLGKLAETLGIDPVSTRKYLKTRVKKLIVSGKKEIIKDFANA